MGIRAKAAILIIVSVLLSFTAVSAADMLELKILQVNTNLPDMKLYVCVSDEEGNPIADIPADKYKMTAVLGESPAAVNEIRPFKASGEGIAYTFLVDISKSLKTDEFNEVKAVLDKFSGGMGPNDYASIITFGENVKIVQPYTNDRAVVGDGIKSLKVSGDKTRFYEGLKKALEMSTARTEGLPDRRVIIAATDGKDDFAGGITREELLGVMEEKNVPVYAIGVSQGQPTKESQQCLDILGELARSSSGEYYQMGQKTMDEIYSSMRDKIDGCQIVKLTCSGYKADGNLYRLNVSLADGANTVSGGADVRLINNPAGDENPAGDTVEAAVSVPDAAAASSTQEGVRFMEKYLVYICIAAGVLVLLLGAYLLRGRLRRLFIIFIPPKKEDEVPVAPQPKGVKIRLTVVDAKREQKSYEMVLRDKLSIGRSKSCNLALEDNQLSKKHCELVLKDERIYAGDLNSTNGTQVNGVKVPANSRQRIEDNDMISIGQTELRIRIL